MSRKRPGPFGGWSSRPSRKTTPRSYSRATLIAAKRKISRMKRTAPTRIRAAITGDPMRARVRGAVARSARARRAPRLDLVAGAQLLAVGRPRAPELAVDEDEPVAADDAASCRRSVFGPTSTGLRRTCTSLTTTNAISAADRGGDAEDAAAARRRRRRRRLEEQERAERRSRSRPRRSSAPWLTTNGSAPMKRGRERASAAARPS